MTNKSKSKKSAVLDAPIPAGGMVRSGGRMVPRFARDMHPDEELPKQMKNLGSGLETVPDNDKDSKTKAKGYAKGGAVRGGGCEVKGKTRGKMV